MLVTACFALAFVGDYALRRTIGSTPVFLVAVDALLAAGLLLYRARPVAGALSITLFSISLSVAIRLAADPALASSALLGRLTRHLDDLGINRALPGLAELWTLSVVAAAPGFQTRRPGAWVAVVSAGCATACLLLRVGSNNRSAVAILLVAMLAVAVGTGLYLQSVGRANVAQTARARSDERADIARELHDVVAHHVTGIVIRAQAAQLVGADPVARDAFADIERGGAAALASMRAIVGSLRGLGPAPSEPSAPLEDVRRLVAPATAGAPAVTVRVDDAADLVPEAVQLAASRIVTEAVTNARRHARRATVVDVQISCRRGALEVGVVDDGQHGTIRSGGFGVVGMRERATALGGSLVAGPRPQVGWEVRAVLPVRADEP